MGDPLLEHAGSQADRAFAQEVESFFLSLRGVGLFLSPSDMEAIDTWLALGIPLHTVLRGLHRGATRKAANNQPIRTLVSLHRSVEKEYRPGATRRSPRSSRSSTSRTIPVDPIPAPQYDALSRLLSAHLESLDGYLERAEGYLELQALFVETRRKVATLQAQPDFGATGPVGKLLELGRHFYEALWELLPAADQQAFFEEARRALLGTREDPAREVELEHLRELIVRLMRQRFQLFEPSKLMALWDENE